MRLTLHGVQALRQPESTGDGDSTAGYDILADLLDIILMFTERGVLAGASSGSVTRLNSCIQYVSHRTGG